MTVSSLVPIHYVSDLRSIQSIISQRYGLWTNPGHAAKISTQPFFSRISSAHGMACLLLTLEALKGFLKEVTEKYLRPVSNNGVHLERLASKFNFHRLYLIALLIRFSIYLTDNRRCICTFSSSLSSPMYQHSEEISGSLKQNQ